MYTSSSSSRISDNLKAQNEKQNKSRTNRKISEIAKLPANNGLWIVAEGGVTLLPHSKQLVQVLLYIYSSKL